MPNQLTAAGHFSDDVCKAIESDSLSNEKACTFDGYYFTPAACIHFYPHIKEEIYNEIIKTYKQM